MSQSLYNIRVDHLTLLALIEEQEGILEEDQLEAFQLNKEDFESKALSYGYIIRKFQNESDTIKAEIDRLSKLKKSADSNLERFKTILLDAMKEFKIEKIESETLKLSLRKSKVIDISEELLETVKTKISASTRYIGNEIGSAIGELETEDHIEIEDYLKISIDIDKAKLKAAIDKEGVIIEGASIVENKNLQIK